MNKYELALVVSAKLDNEGVAAVVDNAKQLIERTGLDIRSTVLGHVQRGGDPTANDSTLSARLAGRAVQLLRDGKANRVVGIINNHIRDYDITEALAATKKNHTKLYRLAYDLAF